MYRISIELKKGQLRDTSSQEILKLVAEELEIQNAENVVVQEERILFSNSVIRLPKNRFFNKFASFSKGEITVALHDNSYIVLLSASIQRIFLHSALLVAVLNLLEVFTLGLASSIVFFWITIYPIIVVVRLVMHYLSFPVYFTGLRNKLQSYLKQPLNS